VVRSEYSEVDEHDRRGDRQPIADDRERPGVARIPFEHQTADRTPVAMCAPPIEQPSGAAVRTPLPQAARKRSSDDSNTLVPPSHGCGAVVLI